MPSGYLVVLALGVLCGTESAFAQAPPQPGAETLPDVARPATTLPLPTLHSIEKYQWAAPKKKPPARDFLKDLTVESFGYNAGLTGTGYESQHLLSPGSFASHGLQCPLCLPFPNMLRTRYTLPAFGAKFTWHLANNRVELFSLFGGINAIKPDNYIWDVQRARSTSFNDAWLLQGITGVRVAVDPHRHLWIGGSAGYLENYGDGKRHWNSYSGNATFRFGR